MIRSVLETMAACWKALVVTDLLFKVTAFVLLTPLISLTFRVFLAVSGRRVLADADIVRFFFHPIGWLTFIVVGAATVTVAALEQSALMTISLAHSQNRRLDALSSLRFVASKSSGVIRIAWRMIVRVLLPTAPLLAVGGGVYAWLLTDHDINYYLTAKPPRFLAAVAIIGAILAALIVLVIRWSTGWSIALQLYLFENVSAAQSLDESRRRVIGNRNKVLGWVVVWFLTNTFFASAATGLVVGTGSWILSGAVHSLGWLAFTLGLVMLIGAAVNLISNLLAVISFAVLQGRFYQRFGQTGQFRLPAFDDNDTRIIRLTAGRLLSFALIATVAAALAGALLLNSVPLQDHVQITAHRGASGRAPENTMASIRAAIEDKADWVEIDVQESRDGVVIVAHDSDLKKVSGHDARIWEMDSEELRSIDVGSYFGPEFAGERVPTLAEVLETCRGQVGVNIELKYYGHDQNLEQKVVDLVEQYEMDESIVVMSLEIAGIQKIKKLRPDWQVGLLTAVVFGDLTRVDADFLAVNGQLATRVFVERVHRRNKTLSVWTINDRLAMSVMISCGVDNLITDDPALARAVLSERSGMNLFERLVVELAYRLGVVPVSDQ